jgi:hypothetical protein
MILTSGRQPGGTRRHDVDVSMGDEFKDAIIRDF